MRLTQLALTSAAILLHVSALAQQSVNFGSSFVVPSGSGVNAVRIGGISVNGSNAIYSVDFSLQPDYSLKISNGNLLTSSQDALEQSLRNTTWRGTYNIDSSVYTTELKIVTAQAGYVGGEISHSGPVADGSIVVRVGGEIIRQYLINGTRYDEDSLNTTQLATVANTTPVGYIIRLKRTRAISYVNGLSASWSSNREYRLSLNGSQLAGTVAVPGDVFGSSTAAASGSLGTVTLTKQ